VVPYFDFFKSFARGLITPGQPILSNILNGSQPAATVKDRARSKAPRRAGQTLYRDKKQFFVDSTILEPPMISAIVFYVMAHHSRWHLSSMMRPFFGVMQVFSDYRAHVFLPSFLLPYFYGMKLRSATLASS